MANFNIAFNRTVKFEAGYTDNPNDAGNWTGGTRGSGKLIGTNHGISAPMLMRYLGKLPTVQDMKSLTADTAKKIYEKFYWIPIKGNDITSQNTANEIFDDAVNSGVISAIKKAQAALTLPETGNMDQLTLKKINGL